MIQAGTGEVILRLFQGTGKNIDLRPPFFKVPEENIDSRSPFWGGF